MKMLTFGILLLPILVGSAALAQNNDACSVDTEAMLALDQNAFDQDIDGGWRTMVRDGNCRAEAADLIRAYINANGETGEIMTWHEGQMRAMEGQTARAIALLRTTHKPPDYDDWFGWNHYVDATLAFLQRDRIELEKARQDLLDLPRPEDFQPLDSSGKPIDVKWPPNLNVVDALLKCFDESYDQAYNQCNSSFTD
ncbi:MAG: hypothetical protein AB8B96_07750 [Lysobacterales bacterium]